MDREEVTVLERAFAEGFRAAGSKRGFLLLAGIPLERSDGGKLVEVTLEEVFEVGTVSPGFARRELAYQPLPDMLIKPRAVLGFVYRSPEGRRSCTLAELLPGRGAAELTHPHHDHSHDHGAVRDHDSGEKVS